jgi:HEPN domain-containing protein
MNKKAREWLEKAAADLQTVALLLTFETYPRTIAAFHCQQTVEKSLKAFLVAHDTPFLFRHDLSYLLDLCLSIDSACRALEPCIVGLTPYAVEMRYPTDLPLTPTSEQVRAFHQQAQTAYAFVQARIEAL